MHKKVLSLILIGCCFILTACSQNAALERKASSLENDMEDKTVPSGTSTEKNDTENEKGKIIHQKTEEGNVVIIYDNQNHIIETIPVIEKTSVSQLTDNLYEVAQSVGSPARYVFFYDIQTCQLSDVFFNPIVIENKYIAYIENGELIIRDIFDEAVFCEKIVKDFTKTADPTSAIISITVDEEKQFTIEYYEGEDYKVVTEIFDGTNAIDYDVLRAEGYEIQNENICINPKSIYEDDWLTEQLADILDTCKDCNWAVTDYFLFDFNDDGVDEYVASIYSSLWVGTAGNHVEILRRNEDGSSDRLFYVTTELFVGSFTESRYAPLAVLREKSDGYYKIVLPYSGMIWEYDAEEDQYANCYQYRAYE